MNTILWIIQIGLGVMMLGIGYMKTFYPVAQLSMFSWTTSSSEGLVRFVGISELLIGLGLILPEWTGILPMLTPLAAVALCIIMLLAMVQHIKDNETHEIGMNALIILLAGFVAVERFIH